MIRREHGLLVASLVAGGCAGDENPEPAAARTCTSCDGPGEPSCAREPATPNDACLVPLAVHDGATDLSISAAFSPVDERILVGSNGALTLLELAGEPPALRELAVFRDQPGRLHVAWSPDGRFALSGGVEVRLFAVDAAGGLEQLGAALDGDTGQLYALAWSPDGTHALTAGSDGGVRLLAIDPSAGTLEVIARFDDVGHPVQALAFSPDGGFALLASEDSSVRLVAVEPAERTLHGVARAELDGWGTAVSFSASGAELLTGSWAPCATVTLWSWPTSEQRLEPVAAFTGHASGVKVARFGPAGGIVATAGHDDTLVLHSSSSGALERIATWNDNLLGVHDVSFSRDGSRLAVAASHGDRVTLLDASACSPPSN